jgi:hypothetical protein
MHVWLAAHDPLTRHAFPEVAQSESPSESTTHRFATQSKPHRPQSDSAQQPSAYLGTHADPQQRWVAGSHPLDVPQMHPGEIVDEHMWRIEPHE